MGWGPSSTGAGQWAGVGVVGETVGRGSPCAPGEGDAPSSSRHVWVSSSSRRVLLSKAVLEQSKSLGVSTGSCLSSAEPRGNAPKSCSSEAFLGAQVPRGADVLRALVRCIWEDVGIPRRGRPR